MGLNMVALQVLIYSLVTFINQDVEGYKWDINEFEMADEQRAIIEPMLGIGRFSEDDKDEPPMGGLYITDLADARSPYSSPLLSSHTGLPQAICVGAEYDGLRIQTEFTARS